ncbi:MAG: VOC family protein [Planctomycetota bacterium]|jgi:catechol 2,3-dioxygenase-like lactoylglutathione lyase family enzyme
MTVHLHLAQIAFSVMDLERTHAFYRDLLGFVPAGGTESFRGPLASEVQGLPDAASICWWMVDQREFMQLEMFQFESPPVRPRPDGWRPCDIGYTAVGLHVRDLDGLLARLDAAGTQLLAPVLGPRGSRRACVLDPDGVLLELMEDDPTPRSPSPRLRPDIPVVARSVTASVPDLARAHRFWVDTLGLSEARDSSLHSAEHEALWGLAGAARETVLLEANDFLIELVQYTDPRGRPWPRGYRISDQGILNIAFGFRELSQFREIYQRVVEQGYKPNREAVEFGDGGVVYVNDDQGFSVELLCANPAADAAIGFAPRETGTLSDLGAGTNDSGE